jgi:hypothetical protein
MDTHTGIRKAIETPTICDDLVARFNTFGRSLISIEKAVVSVRVRRRVRKVRWIEENTHL